jgi:chromosome segregation ATPase
MIGKVNLLMAERNEALVEVRSQITEIRAISVDRDSAEDHNGFLRDKCQKLEEERDAARAEVEGLRADLLAYPPETHTELAAERQRHLELMEDYDRREVVITTLEEALKRTENALKAAQAQHIDERLKGFLAVISQLADQSQDLLP